MTQTEFKLLQHPTVPTSHVESFTSVISPKSESTSSSSPRTVVSCSEYNSSLSFHHKDEEDDPTPSNNQYIEIDINKSKAVPSIIVEEKGRLLSNRKVTTSESSLHADTQIIIDGIEDKSLPNTIKTNKTTASTQSDINNNNITMPPQTAPKTYTEGEIPSMATPCSTDSSISLNYLYSSSLNSYNNSSNNNEDENHNRDVNNRNNVNGTPNHNTHSNSMDLSPTRELDNIATHPLGERRKYIQNCKSDEDEHDELDEPRQESWGTEGRIPSSFVSKIFNNTANSSSYLKGGDDDPTVPMNKMEDNDILSMNDSITCKSCSSTRSSSSRCSSSNNRKILNNYRPQTLTTEEYKDMTIKNNTTQTKTLNIQDNIDRNNNMHKDWDDGDYNDDDEKINPLFMYQYLQNLDDRRKEALEKFYSAAVENPCKALQCDNPLQQMWQNCNFIPHSKQNTECNTNDNMNIVTNSSHSYDPFDRNIVGPRSCEYCSAPTTLHCAKDCPRPKLFFMRKKPPFENESTCLTNAGGW